MNIGAKIGYPAVMEQTAEECVELAQVCLKIARKLRGENPTPKRGADLINDFLEEFSDVMVCIDALDESGLIDHEKVAEMKEIKRERWERRIREAKGDA